MLEVCALALILGMAAGPILPALAFCGLAGSGLVLGASFALANGYELAWVARVAGAIFLSVQVGYALGLAVWAALRSRRSGRISSSLKRDGRPR